MAKLESAIKEKTVSFISTQKTKQTIQIKRAAVLKIVAIAPSRQGTIRRLIMSQL